MAATVKEETMYTMVQDKEIEMGNLYVIVNNRRYSLAKCKPTIEVYESERKVKLKGRGTEYTVKSCNVALVICDNLDFTQKVDIDFLEKVSAFDLDIEFPRSDGVRMKKALNDIIPKEINLNGVWKFDITEQFKDIKELFPDLIFH